MLLQAKLLLRIMVTPDKDAKTTVYYTDTLPKGLTYVDSTLYLGGTYKSKDKDKGTVTGGTKN
ncbi:hypothetical protein DW911_05705 [Erysipelatoclostridium sp. AM42-17]|nr:hypothetical protein DWZ53_01730 [Coprobacillus sp. AF33-1AC]RHS93878.1 hypothetical protein DW911_05705 [Erysipelatoclostridium sp. AM42-17]